MAIHLHYDESQTILETIQLIYLFLKKRAHKHRSGLNHKQTNTNLFLFPAAVWAITPLQHLMMSSYLWMSLGEGVGKGCCLKKIKSRDRDECLQLFLRTAGSRCLI